MKSIKYFLWISVLLPASAFAWQWMDLWQTPDQQGNALLQAGKVQAAAQVFKDKNWRGVSHYRSGNYQQAYKQFNDNKTSDGQYNAGNAAAFMERYQEAINAYDKAIALNPNNTDAITNREIIKKLLQQNKQQQQNQQQHASSNNNKDDKKSSEQQNQAQKNNSQQDKQDQQKQQQKQSDQQQQAQQNSQNNASANANQKQDKTNNSPQTANEPSTADSKQQRQDENNKQLLRRLSDNPGGLLQQKFLRDYLRHHGMEENSDQGVI